MLTCGFVRSNFAFATVVSSWTCWCFGLKQYECVQLCGLRGYRVTGPSPSPRRLLASEPVRASVASDLRCSLTRRLRDDLLRHVRRNLGVRIEHHGVVRPALGLRPEVAD